MFDPINVYKRGFEPTEGGYLYYPSRWSSGYFVSTAEFEALMADWHRTAGFKGTLKTTGVAIVLIIVAMAISSITNSNVAEASPYIIAVGVCGYIFWKSRAVIRLIRGRKPVRPPRSSREAEAAMGRALGRPLAIFLVLVSLGFVASGIALSQTEPIFGVPMTIVFAVAAFFNARIVIRSFRSNS